MTDENGLPFSMQIIPQTSIINFFAVNTKRPMGGHRDAAEMINAPLVSVSLGNSAIFLISESDHCEPLPLWLRSGDVLIMTGQARFALHCVARVVPNSCPKPLIQSFESQETMNEKKELKLMKLYIMQSRINFNLRQVIEVTTTDTHDFHEIHSF